MPLQAQELGFLEVRRQSLEVRELSNPTEEQILELYNMDFISSIKIWINTAQLDKKGMLLQAIQNLLINMIKVTNELKVGTIKVKRETVRNTKAIQRVVAQLQGKLSSEEIAAKYEDDDLAPDEVVGMSNEEIYR